MTETDVLKTLLRFTRNKEKRPSENFPEQFLSYFDSSFYENSEKFRKEIYLETVSSLLDWEYVEQLLNLCDDYSYWTIIYGRLSRGYTVSTEAFFKLWKSSEFKNDSIIRNAMNIRDISLSKVLKMIELESQA